jgi:hypothetical protein
MIFTNDRDFHERMQPDDLLCSVLRRQYAFSGGITSVVLRIGSFSLDLRPDEARRLADLLVQHSEPR